MTSENNDMPFQSFQKFHWRQSCREFTVPSDRKKPIIAEDNMTLNMVREFRLSDTQMWKLHINKLRLEPKKRNHRSVTIMRMQNFEPIINKLISGI